MRFLLSVDWRSRFVFEFLLPDPEAVLEIRKERAKRGTHPVDEHLDLERIKRQVELFALTALHFKRQDMQVYVREHFESVPALILDDTTETLESA